MHALPARSFWFPVLLILIGAGMLLHRLHFMWFGWPAVLWMFVTVGGGVKLYNGLVLKSRGGVFWGLFWFVLGGACLLRACGIVWLAPGIVVSGLFLVVGAGPGGKKAMPNGRCSPVAKGAALAALAAPSAALNTVTRPAALSATKTSPFGATRTTRGENTCSFSVPGFIWIVRPSAFVCHDTTGIICRPGAYCNR